MASAQDVVVSGQWKHRRARTMEGNNACGLRLALNDSSRVPPIKPTNLGSDLMRPHMENKSIWKLLAKDSTPSRKAAGEIVLASETEVRASRSSPPAVVVGDCTEERSFFEAPVPPAEAARFTGTEGDSNGTRLT